MVQGLLGPAQHGRGHGGDDADLAAPLGQQLQGRRDARVDGLPVVADAPGVALGVAVQRDADLQAGAELVEQVEPLRVELDAVGLHRHPHDLRLGGEFAQDLAMASRPAVSGSPPWSSTASGRCRKSRASWPIWSALIRAPPGTSLRFS